MRKFKAVIKTIREGLVQVVFPNVCLCCGEEVLKPGEHICPFCLHRRFEDANAENRPASSAVILPAGVVIQHALWKFDKGGMLQELMHHLKYERLTGVGTQLGAVLARRARRHPVIRRLVRNRNPVLVPVPLHYLKFRQRGFNQAFYIARGVAGEFGWPICPIDAVVRHKYTRSQTGFTLQKRIENMRGAFRVRRPACVETRLVVVIDDVFTTGATSFELAATLRAAGADAVMIWTLAQA